MASPSIGRESQLAGAAREVVDEAVGRTTRPDPSTGRTGGPAGNATLTAWTGLLLLAMFLVELATLLNVHGLISWHIVVGTLLVPFALLKTASTFWRIVRYYTGHRSYRVGGPPPMALRLLGPLVVLSTLGVLGTGLALVPLGPDAGRQPFLTVLGFAVDPLTLHQGFFLLFLAATGLHVLGRMVPAARLAAGKVHESSPRGRVVRAAILLLTTATAVVTAMLVLGASSSWQHDHGFFHEGDHQPPGVAAGR